MRPRGRSIGPEPDVRRLARRGAATLLAVFLTGAALTPSLAHTCSCADRRPDAAERWQRPWRGRPVVFIGYPLEVDEPFDRSLRAPNQRVRFVTEQSWRGALPDTVTLLAVADRSCPFGYAVGWRYLVIADRDPRDPRRLTTGVCDYTRHADSTMVRRLRQDEGPPNWTAPPPWNRGLDSGAIPLGTPLPRAPHTRGIRFGSYVSDSTVLFEFGDFKGRYHPSGGPILYPAPGLYHFRVTWADGAQFRGYLSVRCEFQVVPGMCSGGVGNVVGLRPAR